LSHIPIDTHRFHPLEITPKLYDILFVAQFVDRKMPFFVAEVLNRLSLVRHVSALIVGGGPLFPEFKRLVNPSVSLRVVHKSEYDQMPYYYRLSKILLLPTKCELWGQVAGEALASGVPVITCANAACAGEMVWDHINGFIMPLIAQGWAERVQKLLGGDMSRLSHSAVKTAEQFTVERSVEAIMDAITNG
jgi:glycosyltransferase involved in cell wall biosynthesis